MSNLGLKTVQMLVPANKYNVKCPYSMTPNYITIHNTANNASALAEISYMNGNWNEVSYHWAVDDIQAIQAIPHNRNAWHCGDGGSGTGNRQSIGIEICHSLTPGNPRYAKSEDNGAKLTAIILKSYGWGIDRIRKHQDWSGKYCLPVERTELLTETGWKYLKDIKIGDTVATYRLDDGAIIFDTVQDMVGQKKQDTYLVRGIEATSDHRMLFKGQDSANLRVGTLKDLANRSSTQYVPNAGMLKEEGLPITDVYLEFLVAFYAKGEYLRDSNKAIYGIEFNLNKDVHVERILGILEAIGATYTKTPQTDGTTKIVTTEDEAVLGTLELFINKSFTWDWLNLSEEQAKRFLQALVIYKGSEEENAYFTSNKTNLDIVQAIASTHGVGTRTGWEGKGLVFSKEFRTIDTQGSLSAIAERKQQTVVDCVTVNTGFILIRQNGRTTVVGNCPHRILDNGNWNGFKQKVQQYLNQLNGKPTTAPTPTSTTKPASTPVSVKEYAENGTFTATEDIYFRNEPNLLGKTQGMYYKGESVVYDRVRIDVKGFVWISWISASKGVRRWLPTGETVNGKRSGKPWGTFK